MVSRRTRRAWASAMRGGSRSSAMAGRSPGSLPAWRSMMFGEVVGDLQARGAGADDGDPGAAERLCVAVGCRVQQAAGVVITSSPGGHVRGVIVTGGDDDLPGGISARRSLQFPALVVAVDPFDPGAHVDVECVALSVALEIADDLVAGREQPGVRRMGGV